MGNGYPGSAYRRVQHFDADLGSGSRGIQPTAPRARSGAALYEFGTGRRIGQERARDLGRTIQRRLPTVPAPRQGVRAAEKVADGLHPQWYARKPRSWSRAVPARYVASSVLHGGHHVLAAALPWIRAAEFGWYGYRLARTALLVRGLTQHGFTGGWTRQAKCPSPGGPPTHLWRNQGTVPAYVNTCLAGQGVPSSSPEWVGWPSHPLSSSVGMTVCRAYPVFAGAIYPNQWRMQLLEYWNRPVALRHTPGSYIPPRTIPTLRPWPRPNGWALRGYRFPTVPPSIPATYLPGPTIFVTRTALRSFPPRKWYFRRTPRTNEMEQKFYLGIGPKSLPGRFMRVHGEAADFTEAFYSELPNYVKHGQGTADDTLAGRWRIIEANLHLFTEGEAGRARLGRALLNLVVNQIEDYGFGRIGSGVAVVNRQLRLPVGALQIYSLARGGAPSSLGYFL